MPPSIAKTSITQLDALLPQLQCGQCSFSGCLPYASAMVHDNALPNRCPPGGAVVLERLSAATGVAVTGIAADCGPAPSQGIAQIDENWCIGCTKCIAVCPVDAIIGANRKMHVVMQQECTGCDLCLAVCPVDCITMLPRANAYADDEPAKTQSRQRAAARRGRLLDATAPVSGAPALGTQAANAAAAATAAAADAAQKSAILASVLARARSRS